jgi:molybdopterin converting factor small subunit
MIVQVKLFATLRRYHPAGETNEPAVVELADGATVADLLARLGILPSHAGMVISRDEKLALHAPLVDGQEVILFPPIAGGV